jgi:serine/threonine-protein kinase HipA
MKKITVFFCGWGEKWPLGTLADNSRDLLFEYSPTAIAKNIEFSPRHLKLRAQAYADFPAHQFRLPGLVADALPDGWGLRLMDQVLARLGFLPHHISPLDRLAFLGDRAMGALVFEPATDIALPAEDIALLTLARDVKTKVEDQDIAALTQLAVVGGSPQGARPKALVQYDIGSGRLGTLPSSPGTPWLVKFPARGEHKEVCAIEQLYARLARDCGLDMPRTACFDLGRDLAAFAIERFDRQDGLRVPVHTLAGALHADFRIPAVSYQTLLRNTRAMTRSEREVEKAHERCLFNVIFNNRDDHAKNFSYRMDERFSWKLAPCYDLTFSDGPGGEHQMDIEGEGRYPGRTHLLRLASSNSLDARRAEDAIERMTAVAVNLNRIAREYPIRPATRKRIVDAVGQNCLRMGNTGSA